jgi:hypothetical protein
MKNAQNTQQASPESQTSWQFYLVISVIVLSVLTIALKAIGLF